MKREKKRITIKCDRFTQDRIIRTFEETDLCFFGHGLCGAFHDAEGNPECRECILARAEWEIKND